jgi:hypothetical protein
MNPVGLSKENVTSTEILCLLKTSRDLQILFAAVKNLVEELILETLLTLKVEKPPICLVVTRRPTYPYENNSQFCS